MFALCPRCGEAVEDNGYAEFITCASCGQSIRSRADPAPPRPPEDIEDASELEARSLSHPLPPPPASNIYHPPAGAPYDGAPPPPDADRHPPPPPAGHHGEVPIYYAPPPQSPPDYYRGYNYYTPPRIGRPKAVRGKGYDLAKNIFSALSLFFIILLGLALMSNFLYLVMGIPIVYEGTTTDRLYVNKASMDIIIDGTPPDLNASLSVVNGAPLFMLTGTVADENLGRVEASYGNLAVAITMPMSLAGTTEIGQALDLGSGGGTLTVTACDRSGNSASLTLSVPEIPIPPAYIMPLDLGRYQHTEVRLDVRGGPYVRAYAGVVDGERTVFIQDLQAGQNAYQLPSMAKGVFVLRTVLELNSSSNITTDLTYEAAVTGDLDVAGLSVSRIDNDIYLANEDSLKVETDKRERFMPKELVDISFKSQTKIYTAVLRADDREYELGLGPGQTYGAQVFAPYSPGNYDLNVTVMDVYGRNQSGNLRITVMDIPTPVISVSVDDLGCYSFPAYARPGQKIIAFGSFFAGLTDCTATLSSGGSDMTLGAGPDSTDATKFFSTTAPPTDGKTNLRISASLSYPQHNSFFVILPVPNFLFDLGFSVSGIAFFAWYMFDVLAILASFIALLVIDVVPTFKRMIHPRVARIGREFKLPEMPDIGTKNTFILLLQIFCATIFISMATVLLTLVLGQDFPTPSGLGEETPDWWVLYGLANASVYEEIIARLLLIGIPLLIYEALSRLVFKEKINKLYNCLLGGNMKIRGPDIFLIAFSAVLFGLGHFSGWSAWKVLPTFISGIAFGYLFYRKGIHVSILLHFATDYLSAGTLLDNPYTMLLTTLATLAILGMIGFGFFYCVVYGRNMFAHLFKVRQVGDWDLIKGNAILTAMLSLGFIAFLLYLSGVLDGAAMDYRGVLAAYFMFAFAFIAAGTLFVMLKKPGIALIFMFLGGAFSAPMPFISVLALMTCYDLYGLVVKNRPLWVLKTYKKPIVPLSPTKRTS